MTLAEIKKYGTYKEEKKRLNKILEKNTGTKADEKKLQAVNRRLCSIKNFISRCENPFVKEIMKYRFTEGLSWDMVAARIGGGNSPDGCRMAVNRYFQKLKR